MSDRNYPVTVNNGSSSWPGEPIRAADDDEARRKAGTLAANAPSGVSFAVTDDQGVPLGEYANGGPAW
ncbi:hypothetical protein [Paractinoplanes toevensis]|uniref:Uncharacterized protein n=1 Tax=Paractinoplanes toevensis TaxID=571911 RepID=A0A919T6C3_9ACTN|nr:hypothetical protein [Actinoplanes toevensis]GIM88816.1 hypothetical protein Ato02nite_006090 [Actinoplanes toevensis]